MCVCVVCVYIYVVHFDYNGFLISSYRKNIYFQEFKNVVFRYKLVNNVTRSSTSMNLSSMIPTLSMDNSSFSFKCIYGGICCKL